MKKNKRDLKPKILIWVCVFVLIQLIIMNAILSTIIGCLVAENSSIWADATIISEIFEFLKYYITATIVELLGMLYFMIRKVFDNSIIDIFKLNRRENNKKNSKNDKQQKKDSC